MLLQVGDSVLKNTYVSHSIINNIHVADLLQNVALFMPAEKTFKWLPIPLPNAPHAQCVLNILCPSPR